MKKSQNIQLRVSQNEYENIEKAANTLHMSFTQYQRFLLNEFSLTINGLSAGYGDQNTALNYISMRTRHLVRGMFSRMSEKETK